MDTRISATIRSLRRQSFPLSVRSGNVANATNSALLTQANFAVMHNSSPNYVLGSKNETAPALITFLSGAAATWPLVARAQQPVTIRRIGILMNVAADDPEAQDRNLAFLQALHELGWTEDRNVEVDYRWAAGDADRLRRYAAELVALAPAVVLASGTSTVGPLQRASATVPIVFAGVADPVGAGFVDSMARPGRNATGFISFEYGLSAKWLELLKQVAPGVRRVAVLRDPDISGDAGESGADRVGGAVVRGRVESNQRTRLREIERAIAAFARSPNGGMILGPLVTGLFIANATIARRRRSSHSFVNGTAANDTFNINNGNSTVTTGVSRRLGWTETTCSPSLTWLATFLSPAAQAMTVLAQALAASPRSRLRRGWQ